MDSLVANYASSDEEEQNPVVAKTPNPTAKSLLGSLPRPKSSSSSSSLFSSLPPPKTITTVTSSSSYSSSFFSSLTPPKLEQQVEHSRPCSNARKVVKFTPPINPSLLKPLDDDDDVGDDWKERKPVSDFSKKSLADVMPLPKNSMGLGRGAASSGRRYALEAAAILVKKEEVESAPMVETSDFRAYDGHDGVWVGGSQAEGQWNRGNGDASTYVTGGYYGGDVVSVGGSDTEAQWSYGEGDASTSRRESNGDYYGDYNGATTEAISVAPTMPSDFGRIGGKRGRNDIPLDIVEVKQDELVKDRPREDQVKLTGIAFGPAYQPVVSSQKGKPTKLHKRKHQIGSLYFDMRQKEMELTERRSRGLLTKRETQGKYGW